MFFLMILFCLFWSFLLSANKGHIDFPDSVLQLRGQLTKCGKCVLSRKQISAEGFGRSDQSRQRIGRGRVIDSQLIMSAIKGPIHFSDSVFQFQCVKCVVAKPNQCGGFRQSRQRAGRGRVCQAHSAFSPTFFVHAALVPCWDGMGLLLIRQTTA